MFADSIDAKGLPVNPRFTFSPAAPQITLGVQLGRLTSDPGDLVVAWSQETDTGSNPLFTVHLAVHSGEVAFSTARSQGSLAEGTYLVTVSLDGQSQQPQVDVAAGAIAFTAAATEPGGTGQPPVQGPSGIAFDYGGQYPTGDLPSDPPGCVRQFDSSLIPDTTLLGDTAATVDAAILENCEGMSGVSPTPVTVQLRVTIDDSGQVYQGVIAGQDWTRVDPCTLGPTASDLPGTSVDAELSWLDGSVWRYWGSGGIYLGDDTSAPQLRVTSEPAAGTTVKPGDTVAIDATGSELKQDGGPWQTGVQSVVVTADPGGEVGTWQNPSNLPQPCDAKTWSHELQATYTVPANPPSVIKICAVTQDYVANERSKCASFPTTDKVTITGTIEQKQDVATLVPEDQGHIHDVIDETATFTVVSTDGKTLTGTEVTRFFDDHQIVEPRLPPVCHNEKDASGNLSWTAQLTGTISRASDGSLTIAAQGTPQQSPGFPLGACAGNGTTHLYLLPVVGRLVNGMLDLHVDYPLHAEQSGYETLDLHMNVVPNQAAGG